MSFLDNLENSLKNLESADERSGADRQRQETERARALAAAPWADQLKTSPYTKKLFDQAALAGHRIRAKVYMAWLDTTLRLEAKGRKLDLRPTKEGIVADLIEPEGQIKTIPVDLNSDPDQLLNTWLAAEPEATSGSRNNDYGSV